MWNIGYTFFDASQPDARERWQAQAIDRNDGFVMHFRALARELDMAIYGILTSLDVEPPFIRADAKR
jgi:hypothetical protein